MAGKVEEKKVPGVISGEMWFSVKMASFVEAFFMCSREKYFSKRKKRKKEKKKAYSKSGVGKKQGSRQMIQRHF